LMTEVYQQHGSWNTRHGHKTWELIEVAA